MKGIAGTEHDSHPAEKPELCGLGLPDHQNSECDNGYEIDCIEGGFHNSLHTNVLSYCIN